jgi:hypothetical protein
MTVAALGSVLKVPRPPPPHLGGSQHRDAGIAGLIAPFWRSEIRPSIHACIAQLESGGVDLGRGRMVRTGLYRFWAVATVLWIMLVALLGLQVVPRNVASKYIYIPGDPRRYQPYNPPPAIDDGRLVRLDDGSQLYFHRSIWMYEDNNDLNPIISDFWETRWFRYFGHVFPWLFLAVLPGALFIIIYALLWIADGFRKAA